MRKIFFCLALASAAGLAQTTREDVVVLKDSMIIRGTFASPVAPGGEVCITRKNGKTAVVSWREAALVRRLPSGISDSLLLEITFGGTDSESGGERVLGVLYSAPGTRGEDSSLIDVMLLGDGTILRGTLLETQRGIGPYVLWTPDGRMRKLPMGEVRSALRLPGGTTDSAITVLYVNPPPELLADNFRVITLFGGIATPAGSYATPKEAGGVPASGGFAGGVHVSVRIFPPWRISGTAAFARHPSSLPALATLLTGSGAPPAQTVFWILAGPELRTEGTSAIKASVFAQAGMVFMRYGSFDFAIRETGGHTAGTAHQEGVDARGAAFCIGAGISYDRLSVTVRWLNGTVPAAFTTVVSLEHYLPITYAYDFDQGLSDVSIGLGFSPF